jgi:cell division protein FtsI (penicillin-binding protein 3)
LREKLRQGMVTYSAKGAYGVVMDVNNGELLALVSLQDFDPNKAGSADPKNLFNNVTSACFEMGSTFKIFTTAMVLDSGVATLDSLYDATQPLVLGRFRVRDDHPRNAWLNVAEIFMYSSNIGCAKMARDLGVAGQRAFFEKIGFLKPVTCEIPEVAAPLLPSNWSEISLQTISYGYGLAVSLLHVAAGTASIINGGYFYQPTLVAGANNNTKPVKVVSEETSRIIRHLMRLVVQEGTGRKSSVRGYSVGGKTGSARKVGEGGYKHGTIMASFISVFPIEEKPRYLVYVVLNEPKGTSETYQHVNGGWNAGPITASVIEEIAPLLGVEPKEEVMPVRARVPLVSVAAVVP